VKRRRYLIGTLGIVGSMAGCLGSSGGSDDDGGATPTDTATATATTTTTIASDEPATGTTTDDPSSGPIERSELNRGARKDAIPAITEPAFGSDWSDTEFELNDDDEVIGVARDGQARAYPLRILDWHEIVNDEFAGPLLVTYCPLCDSGMTAVRKAGEQVTPFGVSGYLYRSDLVMYDEATGSLWSQIMATAINGELTGETLTLVPSSLTTWGAWTADRPETAVLLPPPASGTIVDASPRPYDSDPYSGYDESRRVGIGFNDFDDDRLHPKAQVIGIATENAARAYPFETVLTEGVVNDRVGDLPVVVVAGPSESLFAYDRRVDGETLTFESAGDRRMAAGGSEWKITTGKAVSGPHEGIRLDQASDATTMFWFAWAEFNPDTEIYGRDG
jgi:hypothetical protein